MNILINLKKIKLKNLLILILPILIFFYTFYKSEIVFDGFDRSYYLKYYIISLFLLIFSTVYILINTEFKKKIDLFAILSLIFLYSAELVLSLDFYRNYYFKEYEKYIEKYENKTNLTYDKRSVHEVFSEELKKDPKISIAIGSSKININNDNLYPLSGVSNINTLGCNLNGYWSKFVSDRYGFNNPDFVWENINLDVSNVMLFGNTKVHSNCINSPNDLSGLIRANISKNFNIINLAAKASNGPIANYAVLKEYSNALKPQKILWFFDEEIEFESLISELSNPMLRKYFDNYYYSQDLISKQKEVDIIMKKKIKLKLKMEKKKENINKQLDFNKFIKFLKLNFVRTNYLYKYFNRKNLDNKMPTIPKEFDRLLNLIFKFSDDNNAEAYFIFLPSYKRFFNEHVFYNELSNQILNIAKEIGFKTIDLTEDFKYYDDPKNLFAVKYFHGYSKEANELISKKILNEIFKN